MAIDETTLAQVFEGYADCALWSSTDDDGRPMNDRFDVGDIARACRERMRADCRDFLRASSALLAEADLHPEQIGHDFWLTRNRHGAGFWDRGLGEVGEKLSSIAHAYGESYLYAGTDGRVFVG